MSATDPDDLIEVYLIARRSLDAGDFRHVSRLMLGPFGDFLVATSLGVEALHHAIDSGISNLVYILISMDTDCSAPFAFPEETTAIGALNRAISMQRLDYVSAILEHKKFNPNKYSKDEIPPIIVAAIFGDVDIVQCLLDHDANPKLASGVVNAADLATLRRHPAILDMLLRKKRSLVGSMPILKLVSALHPSRCTDAVRVIRILLSHVPELAKSELHLAKGLWMAVQDGCRSTCFELVDLGADVDKVGYYCDGLVRNATALHIAAFKGTVSMLKFLLEDCNSQSLNLPDENGMTPLAYALRYNPDPNVVRYLLRQGANPHIARTRVLLKLPIDGYTQDEVEDLKSVTAMCRRAERRLCIIDQDTAEASDNGSLSASAKEDKCWVIRSNGVLERRIWPSTVDLLHAAAICGRVSLLKHLYSSGVDMGLCDVIGDTPLISCLASPPEASDSQDKRETIQFLVEVCPEAVNTTASDGWSPLIWAARRGFYSACKALLRAGADVNYSTKSSRPDTALHHTALHYAAYYGWGRIIRLLLAHDADPSMRTNGNCDSLWVAICGGRCDEDLYRLLLQHGASPHGIRRGKEKLPVIHMAAHQGDSLAIRVLVEHGADAGVLNGIGRIAIHHVGLKYVEIVQTLVEEFGVDPCAADHFGATPLHVLAAEGLAYYASVVQSFGGDINARDAEGRTPLMLACGAAYGKPKRVFQYHVDDQVDTVRAIVDKLGGRLHARSKQGLTALHFAAAAGRQEIVACLIAFDARLEARTNGGRTALHSAACLGHEKVVRVLLDKGANVNCRDNKGRTALYSACKYGKHGIAKLLIEAGADVGPMTVPERSPLRSAALSGSVTLSMMILTQWKKTTSYQESSVLKIAEEARGRGLQRVATALDGRV